MGTFSDRQRQRELAREATRLLRAVDRRERAKAERAPPLSSSYVELEVPEMSRDPRGQPINAPPGFIHPCRAIVAKRPPVGPGWVHELKHDGYRLQIHVRDGRVRLFTMNAQLDRTLSAHCRASRTHQGRCHLSVLMRKARLSSTTKCTRRCALSAWRASCQNDLGRFIGPGRRRCGSRSRTRRHRQQLDLTGRSERQTPSLAVRRVFLARLSASDALLQAKPKA